MTRMILVLFIGPQLDVNRNTSCFRYVAVVVFLLVCMLLCLFIFFTKGLRRYQGTKIIFESPLS